ncbi:MAG: hypothetical protein IJ679_05405 [Lachnospiraceae bacterium]|nr:hypothetical protein [Lachnospiraceae bacterium]
MSTRERAIDIVSKMNENQLEGFVAMFELFFPEVDLDGGLEEREKAFDEIERITHPILDLDYDKELAEAREEKYGR